MTDASDVIDFWFADALTSVAAMQRQYRRWFIQDATFDALIAERFADLPVQAAQGRLRHWAATPTSALAQVIVLDQFPRHLYRNTPRAYAFDGKAVAEADAAVQHGHDTALHPLQAAFLYMPFQHAESMPMQDRSVKLFQGLRARAPATLNAMIDDFVGYAWRHRAVIERFGRFPHRNAVLGRSPDEAEDQYLQSGGERFGVVQPGS